MRRICAVVAMHRGQGPAADGGDMGDMGGSQVDLRQTPLHALHLSLGARMVPFAGWDMPVQFPIGVLREHLNTRAAAGLFDVSHMGQVILRHPDGVSGASGAAAALEGLCPQDLIGLAEGRQRYALFTDANGGILDDLMVANRGDHLFLVVNAANAMADLAHLAAGLPGCTVEHVTDRALIALQGPGSAAALEPLAPGVAGMRFMDVATVAVAGGEIWVSRSGYTGEDGFEISLPAAEAEGFVRALLDQPGVAPVGLGARDSLRLEAALCLHGSDIGPDTTPAEAGLGWAIQKARRTGGTRAGGFPGAGRVLHELDQGPVRLRVGLRPEGRAPMRAGTALFADDADGAVVGRVTSGGFGPSVDGPVAMGYVAAARAAPGARLFGEVRGRRLPVTVSDLPFHPHSYRR